VIEISDPVYFIAYFIAICISVRYHAANKSYIGVKISDEARYLLLIFSFEELKISIILVISQIYLYILLLSFIASKIAAPEIIATVTNDPNGLLSTLVLSHSMLYIVGIIESDICEWRFKRRR